MPKAGSPINPGNRTLGESAQTSADISAQHVEQFVGRLRFAAGRCALFVDHVHVNMVFNHFRHDAVDGAPRRGQKPHDLGAAGLGIQAPFQRVDLASQPAHAVEQFLLVGDGVGHLALPRDGEAHTPYGIMRQTSVPRVTILAAGK